MNSGCCKADAYTGALKSRKILTENKVLTWGSGTPWGTSPSWGGFHVLLLLFESFNIEIDGRRGWSTHSYIIR